MTAIWSGLRRELSACRVAAICAAVACCLYIVDGMTAPYDSTAVYFTWCGTFSFVLVGILAYRIARRGKGHWSEWLALPLVIWLGLLWLLNAFYALPDSVLWFGLSFVAPSLLFFLLIFFILRKQRARFVNAAGKLTDAFYLLKTFLSLVVWVTSVISLAAGSKSFDPQLIALSFSGIPALMAVLMLETSLRYHSLRRHPGETRAWKAAAIGWRAGCLAASLVSLLLIALQFRSVAEMARYVPDQPQPWIGWLSFVFIGLFTFIALRPRAGMRGLAVGFIYIWAFYGHYALNVAYSPSPQSQIATLLAVFALYSLVIFAVFWRARAVLLDEGGKVSDLFEYVKSLASGFGWIMATLVILIFSRMHQTTMPIVLWGGVPLSVAPLMLIQFGCESYFRWRQIAKSRGEAGAVLGATIKLRTYLLWLSPLLTGLGFTPAGLKLLGIAAVLLMPLCVYRAYQIHNNYRGSFFVLAWFWTVTGIYALTVTLQEAGISPVATGMILLPLYTLFHMGSSWRRRQELLQQNGQIGEGFQYVKATTACVTWLLGTVSLVIYKIWSVSGDAGSPYLVVAIPLSIAPMVSGLYLMEAWLRSRGDRGRPIETNGISL